MKQETAEDMLEFAKEVCQKYSRVKNAGGGNTNAVEAGS